MALSKRTIALGLGATAAGGFTWMVAKRPKHLPGRVELVHAPKSTVIGSNGAVRSVQTARLALPKPELERLWTPPNLDNLGATYWHFLTYVTLGTVRVRHSDTDRRVTLFGIRALTLLRFHPPTFEMEAERAKVSWEIIDGLLVASRGRAQGGLSLEVTREPDAEREGAQDDDRVELTIEVEVTNFYPSLSSYLGDMFYEGTQAVIHVAVTNAFLRSLASLELHQSTISRILVGSLDDPDRPA